MSSPVTTRLSASSVVAVDRAVTAGLAPSRAALVAAAVDEWLTRHSEEAIAASYARRYGQPDVEHDDLVAALAAFSVAACLAED